MECCLTSSIVATVGCMTKCCCLHAAIQPAHLLPEPQLCAMQAQDRIHRLGQYKPINVVRFIIGSTIEERILKLQVRSPMIFCHPKATCLYIAAEVIVHIGHESVLMYAC